MSFMTKKKKKNTSSINPNQDKNYGVHTTKEPRDLNTIHCFCILYFTLTNSLEINYISDILVIRDRVKNKNKHTFNYTEPILALLHGNINLCVFLPCHK